MSRIPVETSVLNENQRIAAQLRQTFRENRVLCLNLVSSPGSGKTTLLERTLERLTGKMRVAVLTGDIQTDNDARRLARAGFPVKQITTGGTCHLDARMIEKHLDGWSVNSLDLLLIENVGNLVCPASYDLGEHAKVVMLSVTEGEDKPLKYPSIFLRSSLMLLSKMDLLPHVPFDLQAAKKNATSVQPDIEILQVSSTTGVGLEEWISWIESKRRTQP